MAKEDVLARVLTIGDPHAMRGNYDTIKQLKEKCLNLAKDKEVDAIVVLGDLAHYFDKVHLWQWNAITEFLTALSSQVPVVYVLGNHDAENNQIFLQDHHFFKVFKELDKNENKLLIVDDVTPFKIAKASFLFVPYVPPGRFNEAIATKDIPWSKISAVFCHQEFRGAKMGAVVSKSEDVWPEDKPMVISGHIHDRQQLQGNLLYVGTPYCTAFGDNTKKTVSIFDFKEGGVYDEETIDLEMPKKITINTNVENLKDIKIKENNEYRICISDKTEELIKFKKSKKFKEIKKLGKVVFKPVDKVISKRNSDNKNYIELLSGSIKKESKHVQDLFEEVCKEIND